MGIIKRLLSKVFKFRGNAERKHGPPVVKGRKPDGLGILDRLKAKVGLKNKLIELSSLLQGTPPGFKFYGVPGRGVFVRNAPTDRHHYLKSQARKRRRSQDKKNVVVMEHWRDDQAWQKIVKDLKRQGTLGKIPMPTNRELRIMRQKRSLAALAAI